MHTSHRPRFNPLLVLLAAGIVTAGCGSSPVGPAATPAAAPAGSVVGSVSGNHAMPHVAIITAAQLSAGAAIVMDISNGMHGHSLALTAGQVGQVAAGAKVSVDSSTDPHSNGSDPHKHTVTFN